MTAEIAQAVSAVDSAVGVDEYGGSRADVVVYFDNDHGVQALRAEMLRSHRDAFQIVDYQTGVKRPYAQLKAK